MEDMGLISNEKKQTKICTFFPSQEEYILEFANAFIDSSNVYIEEKKCIDYILIIFLNNIVLNYLFCYIIGLKAGRMLLKAANCFDRLQNNFSAYKCYKKAYKCYINIDIDGKL